MNRRESRGKTFDNLKESLMMQQCNPSHSASSSQILNHREASSSHFNIENVESPSRDKNSNDNLALSPSSQKKKLNPKQCEEIYHRLISYD